MLIHRAVLGSIERMSAILIEHFKGKLPFWLSPRQMILIPISDSHIPYAQYVRDQSRESAVCLSGFQKCQKVSQTVPLKFFPLQAQHIDYIYIGTY